MSNYSASSAGEPRSPLFGTATYSTLSPTQTPYSTSRYTYSERSVTPNGSRTGSELSSPRQMRRVILSPAPSSRRAYSDYSDEDSVDDIRQVEAALSIVDDEIANTEDVLTEWSQSRVGSSVGASDYSSQTGFTGQYSGASSIGPSSYVSEGFRTMTDALLDRERRVLSTISERTEERSRPASFVPSGNGGSRPTSMYTNIPATDNRRSVNLEASGASPLPFHSRAATDPSSSHLPAPLATGRVSGRRAGELIAFFEEKRAETESPRLLGHARTLSAPMGPRSPAPRSPAPRSPSPYTTTMSQTLSTFPYSSSTYGHGSMTGYGSSTYGYGSRPSSPTKSSRAGSSVSSSGPITTMSSMLSPPARGTPLTSESRFTPTSNTFTQTRTTTGAYTRTASGGSAASGSVTGGSYSNTFTGFTSTATPTASSLRPPQTSPRSPLTSVRNIVAAWKERTPSLGKSTRSPATSPASPTQGGEGLFSLRRRAERGAARLRDRAMGAVDERADESVIDAGMSGVEDATLSTSGMLPAPFDLEELGQYASAGGTQEPLRIGLLWYLNVHAPPPYRWQRCQALLYPHMLLLSWIAPGGGRGIVTLDLLNCIEVRSVPSPTHPTAQDDVGTFAARTQSQQAAAGVGGEAALGEMGLMETLCPFQLLYSDGIERLGAESARERVRWVSAIWQVLDRAVSIPDRSSTRSPTGSIRTIRSMTSTTSSHSSGTGSASTVYVPPMDELSDIQSLSSSSGISRRPSLASAHHTRATDDGAVSSQGFLYPGDPRVIAPSRSSSLRRTSSMTDLDEEFASALRRARDSRPGLGFGLGLAGGINVGGGSPVTISSGPRLGGPVYMSPPPSARGGSDRKSRASGSEVSSALSDDHFFAARSQTPSTSSFYSSSSFTHRLTDTVTTDTRTTTSGSRTITAGTPTGTFTATSTSGLATDESVALTSGSGTAIVPSSLSYRGTDSASLLGDSHTGSLRSPTSPSRPTLTRSGGVRRRTPRGSRSYTNSYGSTSESTDKENTYSGTYDYSLSTLESYSRTGTTPTASASQSRSRSVTPTPSLSSFDRSTEEQPFFFHRRTLAEPETGYYTAPASPSTASFVSLSTIPSEYETAIVCDTEYETAAKCASDVDTDFATAPPCTPAPTEYITADVCASDVETDFETADCRCKVRESDEVSIQTPSEIPTIPSATPSPLPSPARSLAPSPDMELLSSRTPTPTPRQLELEAADIPLPPSEYVPSEPSERSELSVRLPSPTTLTPTSPTEPSLTLSSPIPIPEQSEISTPSSIELTTSSSAGSEVPPEQPQLPTPSIQLSSDIDSDISLPGPSPIPPLSDIDFGPSTLTLSTITTPTESSITPTPTTQLTPSIPSMPSVVSLPISASTSSSPLAQSSWGVESDLSYESSLLRASPSMVSQAIPELPDNSFETSGLRASSGPETTDSSLLAPTISDVTPSLSPRSPSIAPSTPSSVSITPSSVSISPPTILPTPISDVSPLSAATEPSTLSPETTPTASTISLLPTQYSPLHVPREFVPPEVTLTRSASMLSTVSSVSMSSSRMAPSEFELDVRTEPSLLSTPYTEPRSLRIPTRPPSRAPSEAPLYIPLPPSPMPRTPLEASMRLSTTTPRGGTPSIRSTLETVQSDAPSSILTHDVNRLLQYLNDINEARGAENRELAENIQDIKGTLEDLGALLRERTFPELPPPVPYKDVSVGRSVVSDVSAGRPRTAPPPSAIQEMRSQVTSVRQRPPSVKQGTQTVRQGPRVSRAISLSPPPRRRERSPDTLSESMSFLSSHHSDDFSLMESEPYPMEIPPSPSWPSSSPISSPDGSTSSSPTSAPPSSLTPSEELSDIGLGHLTVPRRQPARTLSATPTPPPLSSSPSTSTVSSATARPTPPISLDGVRNDLAGIRQQIENMLNAQDAANRGLQELRERPAYISMPEPTHVPVDRWDEFSERLRVIEEGLLRLLDRGRAAPAPRLDDEASSVSDGLHGILRGILDDGGDGASHVPPTIIAPVPRQAARSFDAELLDIIGSSSMPPVQPVQGPPALIPLTYRPAPGPRTRSASPVFESDMPPRPGTFPPTRPAPPHETTRLRRPARPPRVPPQPSRIGVGAMPSDIGSQSEAPATMQDAAAQPSAGPRPETGPDIDFEREVQRRRQGRTGSPIFHAQPQAGPSRPPTAPVGAVGEDVPQSSWYPRTEQPTDSQPAGTPVPPPGMTFPQMPQFIAPGPTVVQLPSTFNDILELLRDNRQGALAGLEQQSEMIVYLRNLNQWLERDVHDRHAEIQGVSARLEQTRDEVLPLLNQIAQAMRREAAPGGAYPPPGVTVGGVPGPGVQPPPGNIVIPGQVIPPVMGPNIPGFVPYGESVARFPPERTPSPVRPPRFPQSGVYEAPVIPPGTYPVDVAPRPPYQPPHRVPTSLSESPVIPSPPSRSPSGTESSRSERSPRVTIIPPPQGGLDYGGQPPLIPGQITVVPPPGGVGPPPEGPTVINVSPSRSSSPSGQSEDRSGEFEPQITPPAEPVRGEYTPADAARTDLGSASPPPVQIPSHEAPSDHGAHTTNVVIQQPPQQPQQPQPSPSHPASPSVPPVATSPQPNIIIQPPAQGYGMPMHPGMGPGVPMTGMPMPMPMPMTGSIPHVVAPTISRSTSRGSSASTTTRVEPLTVYHVPSGAHSTRTSSRRTRHRPSRSRSGSPEGPLVIQQPVISPPAPGQTIILPPQTQPGPIALTPSGRPEFSHPPSPIIIHSGGPSHSATPFEVQRSHSGDRYTQRHPSDSYRPPRSAHGYDDERRPRDPRRDHHYQPRSDRDYSDERSPRRVHAGRYRRGDSRDRRRYGRHRPRRSYSTEDSGDYSSDHGSRDRHRRHRHDRSYEGRRHRPRQTSRDRPREISRDRSREGSRYRPRDGSRDYHEEGGARQPHRIAQSPTRERVRPRRVVTGHTEDRHPTVLEYEQHPSPPQTASDIEYEPPPTPRREHSRSEIPHATASSTHPHETPSHTTSAVPPSTYHPKVQIATAPSRVSDTDHDGSALPVRQGPYAHAPSATDSLHKQLMTGPEHEIPILPSDARSAHQTRPTRLPSVMSFPEELEEPEHDQGTLPGTPVSRVVPIPTGDTIAAPTPVIAPPVTTSAADPTIPLVARVHPSEALRTVATPSTAAPSPRAGPVGLPYSGPSDIAAADAERERQERFGELADIMDRTLLDLQEGEEKREQNYRANEEEREKEFINAERRRDMEAQQRREAIWKELEDRLAALPLPSAMSGGSPVPPSGEPPAVDIPPSEPGSSPRTLTPAPPLADDAASIVDSMRAAAERHAQDIHEVVRLEREAAQAERERAQELDRAERDRMHEEYQAHIRALESELSAVRKELDDEKMARATEEAERHERERAERLEQNDMMRNQLGDLTNLVTEQRDEISKKRELSDQRWETKQARWEQKDEEDSHTRNMLETILANQAAMMNSHATAKDELLAEMRDNQRQALDAIEQQRIAYEGTIREMAEAWRADCELHKNETIEAVKATANEQIPYNVQGYLDEFSRSLATEVRMLLSEVGKLREDKRNLEYQIGELLKFKAKYGPGGEFDPSWKPAMVCVPGDAAPQPEPAPPEPEPEVPQQAPSAWRTIPTRGSRRLRRAQAPAPPPPEPQPAPTTQSWATWQPDPAFRPSPPIQPVEHLLAPQQGSPGLFGPRSPRDSIRG